MPPFGVSFFCVGVDNIPSRAADCRPYGRRGFCTKPTATAKAPLCKGGWRRRRLGDCLAYGMYFSIPPSFCFAKIHLPLHKGGFFFCCKLRIISRLSTLASPLGERCRRSRRRERKTCTSRRGCRSLQCRQQNRGVRLIPSCGVDCQK